MDKSQNQSIFHSFSQDTKKNPLKVISVFVIAVMLGLGIGFLLSKNIHSPISSQSTMLQGGKVATGVIYGSNDTTTFKDSAEGVVQSGGINGEGQFHLVRPGGDSQNVYMTSSLVDLSQFIGKKVKVNGATQTAKSAGWLMDVGQVEVVQ